MLYFILLQSSYSHLKTTCGQAEITCIVFYTISFQALAAGTEVKESRPPNYIILMTTPLLALHCTLLLCYAALLSGIITK